MRAVLAPGCTRLVERAAVCEELASVLRHDVRNRLATIRNAAFFVERTVAALGPGALDPRAGRFLALIADEVTAVDDLLGGHAPQARLLGGPVERVTVRALVDAAVADAALPTRVELRVDLDERRQVAVRPAEVALLLRCLLDNAVEAAAGPRTVSILVGSGAGPERLDVVVEDDGPGLDEAGAERALAPFASSKPGHLGLGLNIALRVARGHGGALEIGRGAEGVGLRVAVTMDGVAS